MKRMMRIVLDPEEVAVGRIEINVHEGPIQVGDEGPDFGDYEVNAFMAKRKSGEVAVDAEIPNRTIAIPLSLGYSGDFDAARIAVQGWATKVNHQGGGHLKLEIVGGSYGEAGAKLYVDCVKASLKLGGSSAAARDGIDTDALLTIEALPGWYGDWIEEDPFEGVGDAAATFQILGALPARGEITVTNKGARDHLGLPWHFRREGYSPSAPWAMNIEEWELFGAAAKVTVPGSAGKKVVSHPSLGTSWTAIAAKTLPHHGAYEVLVRAYSESKESLPEARLLWDVGDLIDPSENVAAPIPGAFGFYLISLGFMNLEELPIGAHRVRALLQGRGPAGGEQIAFDRIWFRSILESSGKPTAPRRVTQGLVAPTVLDPFNQSAGNATGKSPTVGPAYTVCTNSDTTDFQIESTENRLIRSSIEDTGTISGFLSGRAIGPGTSKRANHGMGCDVELPPTKSSEIAGGHIVHWVDPENFLAVYLEESVTGKGWHLVVLKEKEGFGFFDTVLLGRSAGMALTGRLETILYDGLLMVTFDGEEVWVNDDADLGPEGALAEGRAYIYDHNVGSSATSRIYDNLEIWTPTFEAVNFAGQQACLSHEGLYRKGPDGAAYGPIARQLSDLPQVPVSGPEGLPVELAVLGTRSDLGRVADSGRDPLKVEFRYRPCWPTVPGL